MALMILGKQEMHAAELLVLWH